MTKVEGQRLDEFDVEEWWDVARLINPKITREQFDADWDQFMRLKAAMTHRRTLS